MSELSHFLSDEVWPHLDAVDAGFLDSLAPGSKASGGSYRMNSPCCGFNQRAYYYPGAKFVICNRQDNCKERYTSIWTVMNGNGFSNKDILDMLCKEVGVAKPSSKKKSAKHSPSAAIRKILLDSAKSDNFKSKIEYFCTQRGMDVSDFHEGFRLGYYPSAAWVKKRLEDLGCSTADAVRFGFLPDESAGANDYDRFKDRVVGFWKQPDGTIRLWGRHLDRNPPKSLNKYIYSRNSVRERPYLISPAQKSPVFLQEGPLDVHSLNSVYGVSSAAIGGAEVFARQALWLFENDIKEIVHVVDGGTAGLNGGVKTIANCESVGVSVRILVINSAQDDFDTLREKGEVDLIREMMLKHISSAEFLARLYINSILINAPYDSTRQLHAAIAALPQQKVKSFESQCKAYGYEFPKIAEAHRLIANLMSLGLNVSDAQTLVSSKLGVCINYSEEAAVAV